MTDEASGRDRLRRGLRWAWRGALVVGLLASPWWVREGLRRLEFFRVRRVVIEGTRYAAPDEIVSRLRVDTTASIWDGVTPLVARVQAHPQVREVRIRRRLPGTLVVQVTERPPVARVNTPAGLVVTDAEGAALPVDPTAIDVDLPVVATRDTLVLRLLSEVQAALPALYAQVSDARRGPEGAVVLDLASVRLLAATDVSTQRLAEALAVQQDLVTRGRTAVELDLHFRDQVVARLSPAP
jgi:cell division septal protein FtsQ